jgi:hypothetical protein
MKIVGLAANFIQSVFFLFKFFNLAVGALLWEDVVHSSFLQ